MQPSAAPSPLRVVIVCAADAAAGDRALRRWQQAAAPGERRSLLRAGADCPCCTGAVALRTALLALLRAGPMDALAIDGGAAALPAALCDTLLAGDFGRPLQLESVTVAADAARLVGLPDGGWPPLLQLQLEAADQVVLSNATAAGDRFDGLVERLRWLFPVGRQLFVEEVQIPPADPAGRADPALRAIGSEAPGWPVWGTGAPPRARPGSDADATPGRVTRTAWPASRVFDRRRLKAALEALAALPGVLRVAGVFRTQRDWYGWQSGGDEPQWEVTAWRLGSRLQVELAAGSPPIDLDGRLADA